MLAVYETHLRNLETKLDDVEQYSRRSCLRLHCLPYPSDGDETAKQCFDKVVKIINKKPKDAKKIIKDHSNIKYAFADINCHLGLRLTGVELCFFNSQEEFQTLLQIYGSNLFFGTSFFVIFFFTFYSVCLNSFE